MKQCTDCKQTKTIDNFYKSHITPAGTQVYKSRCKSCQQIKDRQRWANMSIEQKRKWQEKSNSDKDYHKNYRLTSKYNITLEMFNEMYSNQNGRCFICEEAVSENEIRVDHDHKTGKVRKLLCHNCNVILGHSKEKKEILMKCVEYLSDFF